MNVYAGTSRLPPDTRRQPGIFTYPALRAAEGTTEMADCECLVGCPFFNGRMAHKPATSEMYKKVYCRGSDIQCARYIVFSALGRDAVPIDLFPNQVDRAYDVINASSAKSDQ
jgi:hypothetical protein